MWKGASTPDNFSETTSMSKTKSWSLFFNSVKIVLLDFNMKNNFVGFPNYILDPEELNAKYEGLEIKEDEYFLNNIRINQFRIKENLMKLDQPVNKSKLDYNLFF